MQKNDISIRFLGAARTVTGSRYLVTTGSKKILIDCGLFQGVKSLRLLNWSSFYVNPEEIDLVLLTHGHLDHTGYLPKLVKEGFRGEVWCTGPTLDITKIILQDSARIQEEDAERANAENFTRHRPALPLYTLSDVQRTIPLLRSQPLDQWIRIDKNIECRYEYNGHIIGAASIELRIAGRTIVFSGDIGRKDDLLTYAPVKPKHADILLMESTYGDSLHAADTEDRLAKIIHRAMRNHGTIIIPSFAVERTQLLMYLLHELKRKEEIPSVPLYVDSPMGYHVMQVFRQNLAWHKLSSETCRTISTEINMVQSMDESRQVINSPDTKIVVAGSGMVSGGRVLSYLAKYIADSTATVVLAGYQAEGTRGRALLEGEKEIKMFGKYFPVKAHIENLEGLSSHADQEGLLDWIGALDKTPEKIFLVHGEMSSAEALQKKIKARYGYNSDIPYLNMEYTVTQ